MTLVRIRPRPHSLYVSQGRTVLATDRDGLISQPEHGLFVHETRLLSRCRYLIDGQAPEPVAVSNVEQHSSLGYYITVPPGFPPAPEDRGSGHVRQASQQTLELRITRHAGEGLHEDIDLTNFTQEPTAFTFEMELDADFADLIDSDSAKSKSLGTIRRSWRSPALTFDFRARNGRISIRRSVAIRISRSGSRPTYSRGRIRFPIRLAPGARWHCCVDFIPTIDGTTLSPRHSNDLERWRRDFLTHSAAIQIGGPASLAPLVSSALHRAKEDLAALRLHDLDRAPHAWTMAAGLPIYVALFGRDVLTASWQASILSPDMTRGTLQILPVFQGKQVDDWRDEQPGKMIHEAHTGPRPALQLDPRARYYGSITTSAFYPVALSEFWHWTGDKALAAKLLKPALRALDWLDRYGDFDGDGFFEYLSHSDAGNKHQAWKDSGDAIVDHRGRPVEPPIATCEEQAFAYAAKFQIAELLWWLDEKDLAKRFYREAGELKKRFSEAFWMADLGFYALGLDSRKRQIRAITSNPGHCLAAGIVPKARARRVADRLMRADLFSGWGVRTLSSENAAYNPYSYHRGTVWPVEQGTFALGFMRFGLHGHLERLARSQFDAAALFEHLRLPECFGGQGRDEAPFPALYPKANSPQAWSASSLFCLIQSMLGLYPYAPLNALLVDPHLPEWLPELSLRNLRVGKSVVSLRFWRASGGTKYSVEHVRGPLHVLRQPSPWSLTATTGERVKDLLVSLLPRR